MVASFNRGGLRILRNSAASGIRPNKVDWSGTPGSVGYGLSSVKIPNPDANAIKLSYLVPTVDPGGQDVQGFMIYRNGTVFGRIANSTNVEPALNGLNAGETNDWTVTAYNDSGEGPASDILTVVQQTVGEASPNPPSGGIVVGTPTSNSGTISWTASTTPDVSYNVYVNGPLLPDYNTLDTLLLIADLPSGQSNAIVVKSLKNGYESITGITIVLTTAADLSTIQLARSDDFVSTMYSQAKVTYGSGVHDYTNPANKAAIQDWYKQSGWRSYRQEVAFNTGQRTAQLDFMKAIFANQGGKFQANIGTVGWYGLYRIDSYTEQETYAAAKEDVMGGLSWLKTWLSDSDLAITDLGQILHSVGGPNEVNDGNGTVTPNWARNARIYAETIWQLMRNGKLWDGNYNRTTAKNANGRQYYQYTVNTPGKFSTPTGARADFASYPTYFANVPIMAPSTRAAFTNPQIAEFGGSMLSSSADRLAGKRQLAKFVEIGNPHRYQDGVAPNERQLSNLADMWTTLIPNTGYTPSRPWEGSIEFTECGYNHMGFMPDGSPTVEGRGSGQTYSPDGAVKAPPWVIATYIPMLYALGFKRGWKMHLFEMMDDDDTPSSTKRNYNIQAYFGQIWTPDNDPTGWSALAQFNCIRRMTNLLKDRTNPKVPPAFTPARRPMVVTTRNGVDIIELTKQSGDTLYLVYRNGLSIFKDTTKQDASRIAYTDATGGEVRGLPPDVNVTMRLDHPSGSGDRQVDIFRPNKARWINAGVSTPTLIQAKDTRSVGHDDTSDWSGANPTPDTAVGLVSAGGSFTFAQPYDLQIVRVKTP